MLIDDETLLLFGFQSPCQPDDQEDDPYDK
jgi:hypothetical protein